MTSPFGVLAVCTGNICRSPAVQALLADSWRPGDGIVVSSAGLHARVGEPVAAGMAALLDVPLPGFAARQLEPDLARGAGLVLTMTRDQRGAVVSAAPTALRRVFTVREFVDLARLVRERGLAPVAGSPADRLAAVVAAAPRVRGHRDPHAADDIDDPYGKGAAAYSRAMGEIRRAVHDLVEAVGR